MSVTADERLCKQPSEKRRFLMEFSKLLTVGSSETISGINSIVSANVGETGTDLTISQTGIIDGLGTDSRVVMWIEAGTSERTYRIETLVTTTSGQILEGDGLLHVTDR
jgi:hypothetical protein